MIYINNRDIRKNNKLAFFNNRLKIGSILLLIFVVIVIGSIYASTISNHSPPLNDKGEDFAFTRLDGSVNNLKDYRGKIVILDLWAIWCQPCQYQMLELEKTYNNYNRNELEIISINIDPRESIQQIKDFIDQFTEYGYRLDWIFGIENDNLDKYNPEGKIPALSIFDQNGNLYYSEVGYHNYSSLNTKIDELL